MVADNNAGNKHKVVLQELILIRGDPYSSRSSGDCGAEPGIE